MFQMKYPITEITDLRKQ